MNFKKIGVIAITILFTPIILIISLIMVYYLALFTLTGFNPDFRAIDSCVDAGGVWEDEVRTCRMEE